MNAIAAPDRQEAEEDLARAVRSRVAALLARGRRLSEDELDALVASPQGRHVAQMMTYTACGTPADVGRYLSDFAAAAEADELMVVPASRTLDARLRTLDLVAEVLDPSPAG